MMLSRIAAISIVASLAAPAVAASNAAVPVVSASAAVVSVVDRPEIRSYQPYGTLQFNFRPEPPAVRGDRSSRPEVRMPRPRQPLIEYGAQPYDAGRWYAYCADRFDGGIEPREGPYGPRPIERRCRE